MLFAGLPETGWESYWYGSVEEIADPDKALGFWTGRIQAHAARQGPDGNGNQTEGRAAKCNLGRTLAEGREDTRTGVVPVRAAGRTGIPNGKVEGSGTALPRRAPAGRRRRGGSNGGRADKRGMGHRRMGHARPRAASIRGAGVGDGH